MKEKLHHKAANLRALRFLQVGYSRRIGLNSPSGCLWVIAECDSQCLWLLDHGMSLALLAANVLPLLTVIVVARQRRIFWVTATLIVRPESYDCRLSC